MVYLTNINLSGNELQNAVVQPLATAPSSPKLGQIYCDSVNHKIKWYNGTAWATIGMVVEDSVAGDGKITVDGVEMTVYSLPIASSTTLGGIKIGTGLSVDSTTGTVSVSNEGMAVGSADKLTTARTISLDGDVSGSTSFDGSENVTITATVADDSHNHIISNVDGLQSALDNKVDKVTGKGLSTNDYTTTEKNKLAGIAEGAEVNVQANWTQTTTTADDYIKNKPTLGTMAAETATNYVKKTDAPGYGDILTKTSASSTYVAKNGTDRLMTAAEGTKLAGIAAGAEVNVNADWNATTGDAQILNKPTALSAFTNDEGFIDNTVNNLANYYKKTETYTQTEVDTLIGNLATIKIEVVQTLPATGQSNIIYLVPKSGGSGTNIKDEYLWTGTAFEKIGDTEIDLSSYLTKTGDGKDVTVTFTAASTRTNIASGEKLSVIMGKLAKAFADLKTVAFTGSYSDLTNKPATIKNGTFTIATTQSTNSITLTGTQVLSVTAIDSSTHDVVFCDIDINGMVVTASTASNPTSAINVIVAYI